MKGSELLVKCLENEGVTHIFGIVGKETIDFIHALKDSSIKFISTRHEGAASFMADVYGRLTNRAGVCTATLGPGATNLTSGIASSFKDHSPVVAIVGQADLNRLHQASHQVVDLTTLFSPITKWSIQMKDPNTIHEIVRKAFKTAIYEKPGPVLIEVPENLTTLEVFSQPIPPSAISSTLPDRSSLTQVVEIIRNSIQPILVVGNGVVRAEASFLIRLWAETLNIPVTNTFMAKGILPIDHPLNMFIMGVSKKDLVLEYISKSDLIIAVGLDSEEYQPSEWNTSNAPVIHIDETPAEVDTSYITLVEMIGNIHGTLESLLTYPFDKKPSIYTSIQTKIKEELMTSTIAHSGSGIHPKTIMQTFTSLLDKDTIVLADVGANKMALVKYLHTSSPNKILVSNGFASMGISIPGAIAAKLACPMNQVVAITGDGGFMMSFPEIETASRLELSIVIVVLVDSMLGLEWQQMKKKYPDVYGTTFSNPHFKEIAKSLDLTYIRVENTNDLTAKVEQALSLKKIAIVEIPVNNIGS